MSEPVAIVSYTTRQGRESVDSEVSVGSIAELYEACRLAAPARLVRVLLKGPQGEVRLHFGSFIRAGTADKR